MAKLVHTLPATFDISEDANASIAIDLGGGRLIGIIMAGTWTAAGLFLKASDRLGGTYRDVFDSASSALVLVATPLINQHIGLLPAIKEVANCARFIKLGSGVVATEVQQAADRTVLVMVEHDDLR